jgi:dsDNA-specific endonuclease/ATPase MutS2
MGLALKLYEDLSAAPDDAARFRLIVDTIDALEQQWPRAGELALKSDVRESELRLQKEIELVRSELKKEIELLRSELKKDIAALRGEVQTEIANLRGEVQKDIMGLRGEIQREIAQLRADTQKDIARLEVGLERVRVELKATEASLRTAIHRQTIWVVGAVGAVVGLVRLLEWLVP